MNLDSTLAAGETIQKRADSEKRYEIQKRDMKQFRKELQVGHSPISLNSVTINSWEVNSVTDVTMEVYLETSGGRRHCPAAGQRLGQLDLRLRRTAAAELSMAGMPRRSAEVQRT
jgi:hypothetical protein